MLLIHLGVNEYLWLQNDLRYIAREEAMTNLSGVEFLTDHLIYIDENDNQAKK